MSTTSTVGGVRWPAGTDYTRVVQHAASAFTDADLRQGHAATNMMGMPLVASGQNAVVFLIRTAGGEQAVRCFTTPPHEGSSRYDALAGHLATASPTAITASRWIDAGVTVDGKSWPIVVMPWVAGQPFNIYVEDLLGDSDALRRLADGWVAMVTQLQDADVTHGDLQHGNVLVRGEGELCLVDLDGAWVPEMAVGAPGESGHPNYQHPRRTPTQWGRFGDSFPALVVETGLRALAADSSLEHFLTGENMLFSRADLLDPSGELWTAVLASPDPDVVRLATTLATLCRSHPDTSMTSYAELREGGVAAPSLPTIDLNTTPAPLNDLPPVNGSTTGGASWWTGAPEVAGTAATTSSPSAAASGPAPLISAAPVAAAAFGQGTTFAAAGGATAPSTAPGTFAPVGGPERRGLGAVLGRDVAVGGLLAGAAGALVGTLVGGVLSNGLPERGRPAVLVPVVAMFVGAMILSWQALVAGARRAAARRGGIGAALGVLAGLLSLGPATLIYNAPRLVVARELWDDGLRYPVYDIDPLRSAFAWMIVALLIGLGIGALNGVRSAIAGTLGGAVAGFFGGWLFGAHVAEFRGHLLLVDGLDPSTVIVVTAIGAAMGLAIGVTTRTAARGRLVIVEGRLAGMQTLLPARSATIGRASRNTLVLVDSALAERHVEIVLDERQPRLAVFAGCDPIRVNGVERRDGPLHDGDVLAVGQAFVRFEWKGPTQP